jgi:hypothetical protein
MMRGKQELSLVAALAGLTLQHAVIVRAEPLLTESFTSPSDLQVRGTGFQPNG